MTNKSLFSQRGITLIEVLITIVVSAIALTLIYSVFATGIKLYQKIEVEGQIRDDADYLAAMILNEMYTTPPSYVEYEESKPNLIKLVRLQDKAIEGYLVEDSAAPQKTTDISINQNNLIIQRGSEGETIIDSLTAQLTSMNKGESNERSSSLEVRGGRDCRQVPKKNAMGERIEVTQCTHGTIDLTLILTDSPHQQGSIIKTEPLVLESSFGF
ncbi:type IV pilus modification PilV family protein [Peribacillus deserti]|uniref:Tfp pilus assembly protein n=1 Tax=Peribacillus deserti TaxID=673318 RepID=A0A2N5M705_9BACI|nr:prepilin-type N-terminal cleavage/methylation domain-containing protein [Peribacillus deserti]PLT30158.1 hypothetical protein CUU66_08945 [Peribacillus deserti]